MPNKIVKKNSSSDNLVDSEQGTSNRRSSVISLNDKGVGVGDGARQFFKSATSRGPLFWACCCCIFFLLLIIAVVIIIFVFIYRGLPTVDVIGVQMPESLEDAMSQNEIEIILTDDYSPTKLSFVALIDISISNPNLASLKFTDVLIEAFHPEVDTVSIGTASFDELVLPKDDTIFKRVILEINYEFGAQDPDLVIPYDLRDSCTIPAGATKPIKDLELDLKLSGKFKFTSAIKIKLPSFTYPASFECPSSYGTSVPVSDGQVVDLATVDFEELAKGNVATEEVIDIQESVDAEDVVDAL